MTLRVPPIDQRSFDDLVDAARRRIRQDCPAWTDLSVHDPGLVLVEALAHMTETLIARLNRVPERVYVELLKLIGVQLLPPAAAEATLTFTLGKAAEIAVEIPAGTLDVHDGVVEDPFVAARRELEEETGHRAASWRKLAEFWTAPGFATDTLTHGAPNSRITMRPIAVASASTI